MSGPSDLPTDEKIEGTGSRNGNHATATTDLDALLDGIVENAKQSVRAAFEPDVLELLVTVAANDPAAWVEFKERLRDDADVPMRELAKAMKRTRATLDDERRRARTAECARGQGAAVPEIVVSAAIKDMTDAAELALAVSPKPIFHRGGELVRLQHVEARPVIRPLPLPSLTEALSDVADWLKLNADGDLLPTVPPRAVAEALAARGDWKNIRELVAVMDRPTLRPDGTVLQTPGYDETSRIYYEPSKKFPPVPERPTKQDALAALALLRDEILGDFKFCEPCDRAAALALPLTLIGRQAIDGPTPYFVVRSPERGEGKGLLVHTAAVIATGAEAAPMTQGRDGDEEGKRLLALGREAAPLALFDNLKEPFGSDTLAAAATSKTFKGRLLGSTATLEVPVPVICATGRNLAVRDDLGRRVVLIELNAGVERPDEREGFRHPQLVEWVRAERPRLVVACLTILRWFFSEGVPPVPLRAFGSFEAWSGTVRTALVHLGEADPCAGAKRLREDGDLELEAHRALLRAWETVLKPVPYTIRELIDEAGSSALLRDAVAALDLRLDPAKLDVRKISYALRPLQGRVLDGLRLDRLPKGEHGVEWRLTRIEVPDRSSGARQDARQDGTDCKGGGSVNG